MVVVRILAVVVFAQQSLYLSASARSAAARVAAELNGHWV